MRSPGRLYLLHRSVFDGVGVVVVVDNIHVTRCVPLGQPRELDIQLAFAGRFGIDREVSGLAKLDAWKTHGMCRPSRRQALLCRSPAHSTPYSPVRLSPGPSALTLLASWEGSTLTRMGLVGVACRG